MRMLVAALLLPGAAADCGVLTEAASGGIQSRDEKRNH